MLKGTLACTSRVHRGQPLKGAKGGKTYKPHGKPRCYGYAVEADGVHNVDDEPQHDLEYPDDEAYCYVCYVDEYEDSGGYEIGTFAEEHLAYLAGDSTWRTPRPVSTRQK